MKFTWTDELAESAVKRWNADEHPQAIADSFGITRKALKTKMDRLRKSGMDIKINANQRPSPVNRVDKANAPAVWQDDETDRLVDKWNQGMGEAALAKLLNRSLYSIRARVARMVSIGRCQRGSQRSTKLARPISFAPPYAAKRDENRISLFTAHGRGAVQAFEEKMPGAGVSIMQLSRFSCRFVTGADLFVARRFRKAHTVKPAVRVFTWGPHDLPRRDNRRLSADFGGLSGRAADAWQGRRGDKRPAV